MSNKEILEALALILRAETDYGFSVDYDQQANPIIRIAPKTKVDQTSGKPNIKSPY